MKRGAEEQRAEHHFIKCSQTPSLTRNAATEMSFYAYLFWKEKKKKLLPGQLRQIKVESNPDAAELLLIP